MDLDARPYRSFVRIAELGSFSRAARSLAISQPSLSAMIRELERRLGFDLFHRHNRRISLTPEGRIFLDRARRLVVETDWLNQAARDICETQVRIGVAYHSGDIPERCGLIDGFLAANEGVAVSIVGKTHAQLKEALRTGEIDAAVTLEIEGDASGSAVETDTWGEAERIVLATRPVGLVVPLDDALPARVEGVALRDRPIAILGRAHGVALSEAIARFLTGCGAAALRPPESDARSVLRYAAAIGVAACDLGWARPMSERLRPCAITDCPLSTQLIVVAGRTSRRASAATFVRFAADRGQW